MKVYVLLKTYERESTEVLAVYAHAAPADAQRAVLQANDEYASYTVEEHSVSETVKREKQR